MNDTLSHIEAIVACSEIESLWSMHAARMDDYGFDRLIYGYTGFKTENSLGDADDFVILSNHDPAYLDAFLGRGLYTNAPMMAWALNNVGAKSWAVLQNGSAAEWMTEEARHVHEFNRQMGVVAGYTVSFPPTSSDSKGAIALTARRGLTQDDVEAIWQRHGRDILLINNVTHLKIQSLPYPAPKRALTRRQREVLEWVGRGKSVQDVATILGRTSATVEKHLRLAREALAVDTTGQALIKASFLKQIYRPE